MPWRQRLLGSLLGQLRLAAFASVFVGFTAATTASLLIHQRTLLRQVEAEVVEARGDLEQRLASLRLPPTGQELARLRQDLERQSSSRVLFWVRLGDGRLVTPQPTPHLNAPALAQRAMEAARQGRTDPLERDELALIPTQSAAGRSPQSYRVVKLASGRGYGLWMAEEVSVDLRSLSTLLTWMLVVWSLCLVATLLAISLLTRRIIEPLRELNRMAGAVTSASLATSHLEVHQAPLEVQELAEAYNNLLARLALAWNHQKEFIGTVSHELRNPLTIISGYQRRLLRHPGNLDEEQRKALSTAEAETQRITRMFNDLLDLSRSESGKLQLLLQPVDVDDLLITSCELARSQLNRPLLLQLPPEASLAPIEALAEADRLQQVVMNLIENADKYSPPKAPIRVALAYENDRSLSISVTDEGIGIPPDDLPKIFERFHRGRNVMHLQRSAGLGLSVVKLLVEAMGGRISVESTVGKGSTFRVHLPVFRSPTP